MTLPRGKKMGKGTRKVKQALGAAINRTVVTAALLLLQVIWLAVLAGWLSEYSRLFNAFGLTLSVLMCMAIIRKDSTTPEFKIGWMLVFMIMPVQGGILYLLWGDKRPMLHLRSRLEKAQEAVAPLRRQDPDALRALEQADPRAAQTARYLRDYGPCPLYGGSEVKYYPCGEAMLTDVRAALEGARRFIFVETFILAQGTLWDQMHDILRRKAAEGVEVRLLYDDAGSLTVLPGRYWKTLEAEGIHAVSFNHFVPWLNLVMNNRDHRKILVVDGVTAFTGGVNIADEYVNRYERFGYWKDSAVRVRGPAAWSFATMFLEFWQANRQEPPGAGGPERFRPTPAEAAAAAPEGQCLVQPYCDSPVDRESVSKNVLLEIIMQARETLQIATPYLILDNDLLTALTLAAKRGVTVRIFTPGIPDKKLIYQLTRSYFAPLIRAGVHVYTFTPGFLHAKTWLCDGHIGMVGSVNLDYRSMYLHFECGAILYDAPALAEIRRDFNGLLHDSHEVALTECRTGFAGSLVSAILRMIAPLC